MSEVKPMDDAERDAMVKRLDGYAPQVRNDILRLLTVIASMKHELAMSNTPEPAKCETCEESDDLKLFKASVREQLGGLTQDEWIAANPGDHLWARYGRHDSCAHCGVVRRRDDKNKPCKGKVRVGLRATDGGDDG